MSSYMKIKLTNEERCEWPISGIQEGVRIVTDVEYKTCERCERKDHGWGCWAVCTLVNGGKFELHMRKSTFTNFTRDLFTDGKCELIMNGNLPEGVYYLPYEKHPLESLE